MKKDVPLGKWISYYQMWNARLWHISLVELNDIEPYLTGETVDPVADLPYSDYRAALVLEGASRD